MKVRYSIFFLLMSLTFICGIAVSQTQPGDSNALQVRKVPVDLRDDSGRPFDKAKLGVTLASAPGFENGQVIAKDTVQFTVGDPEGKSYPVDNGESNVSLIVPTDAQAQPFSYHFSAKGNDGKVYVADMPMDVGAEMPRIIHLRAKVKAPVTNGEMFGGVLFLVAAIALVLITFFYLAFRRMLFNRRMEVTSAVVWSNIVTLLYLILVSCTVLVAYLNPSLLTQQAISTYIGLIITFLGFYFFGLIVMMLMTRRRAARS